MEENEIVEVIEDAETVESVESLPDSEEISNKVVEEMDTLITEKLETMPTIDSEEISNQVVQALENMEVETSAIDSFIVENSDSILLSIDLINWWGFIGFPLVCIVTIFWLVFREFMYTRF